MNEHEHKAIVCGWLVKYGINEFYWEQQNDWDIPVFELEDAHGRPDMLFRANERWVVVEFKRGDRLAPLLDAKLELIDYMDDFVNGSATYKADGKVVVPETFIVATGASPQAALLDRRTSIEPREYPKPEWPAAERFDAKIYARDMWRLYTYLGFDYQSDPSVGILTSERFAAPQTKHYQWFDDEGPWQPSMMHNHRGEWYERI